MTQNRKPSTVVVSDRDPGLPYSKGLMASRVMVTGLSAFRAYQVAERIEEVLLDRGSPTVTSKELGEVTVQVLGEVAGERYAKNFVRWQQVERLDLPLVILIGGATGVGKSTIATQLAARLGIVRVVATDAFREQTEAVSVGLKAFLARAAIEGTSVIIEGAHMVPGFVDLEPWEGRVLGIPVVITVEDEEVHRSHFAARGGDVSSRPAERYVRGFDNIRRIQKFTRSRALAHGVPVIPNYSLDQAIAAVVELVIERATERAAGMPEAAADGIVDLNPNGAPAGQILAPEQSPTGHKPVARTDGGAR